MVKKVAQIFLFSWITFFLMTRVTQPQAMGDTLLTIFAGETTSSTEFVPQGFVSVHSTSKISKILGLSEKLQEESEEEEISSHSGIKKKAETKVQNAWYALTHSILIDEVSFENFQRETLQTDSENPIYLLHRVLII